LELFLSLYVSHNPAVTYVCKRFLDECIKAKQAMRAVAVLRVAVLRFRPSPESLTPLHAQFLQACLVAKYVLSLLIGELSFTFVSCQELQGCSPDLGSGDSLRQRMGLHRSVRFGAIIVYGIVCLPIRSDLMLFGYYGGMIQIGQKNFTQACRLFEITLTVPAMALSLIMVEAYKKYVLASLLAQGQMPSLPKSTSSIVQRNMKLCALAYFELGNAFSTYDMGEVLKVANAHQQVFQKARRVLCIVDSSLCCLYSAIVAVVSILTFVCLQDKNIGLVQQVILSLPRLNVKRLTKTYASLSFPCFHLFYYGPVFVILFMQLLFNSPLQVH
jgi:COP9 signalosome complex subunit 3